APRPMRNVAVLQNRRQDRSDAAALAGPHAVVRDRGHVANGGDGEAHRLQRAHRAFAARARALDFDFERADAVLGGLLAGVVGGDLGGVGSRLAAALEAHHAGAGPADGVALCVGDRDHRVVEAGVDVRHAAVDVLALPPADALWFACHMVLPILNSRGAAPRSAGGRTERRAALLLLAGDRLG